MKTNKTTFGIRLTAAVLTAAFCLAFFTACDDKKDAPSEKYTLCGEGISNYTVVIPENADITTEFAARLLADKVQKVTGRKLRIRRDSEDKSETEILVGMTNRMKEKDVQLPECGEYCLYSSGKRIILLGDSYSVAGGIPELVDAIENGGKIPEDKVAQKYEPSETVDNVILLIGDGMGKNHILLSETESPKTVTTGGLYVPEETSVNVFAASFFPNKGEVTTRNVRDETTDSAASATALSTGHKTFNGALGMIPADLDGDGIEDELRSVQNVREAACLKGMKTAVLSTDRQTGATPNAFLVHHSDRYASPVILEQQSAVEQTAQFAPEYVWCAYDSESFAEEFEKTLLQVENEKGFFVMAEEAMIDKYASRLDFDNVIRTVKRLDNVIRIAATYAYCNRSTALIVTADHETGGLTVGEDGEFMWTSDGEHTDTPVGVYALGGGTQVLSGTKDNTDIAKYIFSVINN